ncbi:cytochrome P450 CYP12A2-like [Macrobrachium nipponense]|uniref:cytochrome P450 CYP12A2-like n=1 Tax=Macrobrachium nipponense TaxID=159736 RepID=UPI0030C83CD9
MRAFRGMRRWPYLRSKAGRNLTERSLAPLHRKQEEETSAGDFPMLSGARRLATQSKPAEATIQTGKTYRMAELPSDHQFYSEPSQSLPYLEAYNLMEENADLIFDDGKMLRERSFTLDDATTADPSSPRTAAELPGPKSWPLVGCLPYMISHKDFDPQRLYLFWRALREEFGPIFRKDMPGHPNMIFITDPADVQKMYQSTMYNPIRPGMQSLKKIRGPGGADGKTNTYQDVFLGKAGILAEQGEEWWRVRRQVQKPITNPEIVGRYLPRMNEVAEAFIRRIRSIRDGNNEVPGTFKREMYKWALESLGTIALERRLGILDPNQEKESPSSSRLICLVEQLLEALHETENVKLWQYFPTSSIKKLQEAHDIFTEVALEAIRGTQELVQARLALSEQAVDEGNSKASSSFTASSDSAACPYHSTSSKNKAPETSTLLETLLGLPGLGREDVLTFLLDMLATGIDTTSHTVANMLYLLARNPEEQKRLREEIQTFVPDPQRLTPQQLGSLTYAKAVFRETLRVMPVNVGITRRLTQDTVLSGYLIPKGWQVVMPTMLVNCQERIFPRASEFLPERFLRGSPLAPRHHFAFLPFSFGPRMCIGRRIAYQEVICLIVRILSEFDVDYKHEDIQSVNRLAYGPSRPLKFTFIDRR